MKSADAPELPVANSSGPVRSAPTPTPEPEVVAPATDATPPRWKPPVNSSSVTMLIVALLIVAIMTILYAWRLPPFGGRFEQTDDAFIRGQTTIISPQVSGYVSQVPVNDFQDVKAGDMLVRIEDSIYSARVAQARANVLTQKANLDNSEQAQRSKEVNTFAQDAAIANAEAQLAKAQADLRRTNVLIANGWTTAAVRDQQVAAVRAADAALRQARAARQIGTEDVRAVIVGRHGLNANVEAARAQVRLAEVDLDHTVIRAPQTGQLSEVSVRQGQYVTAGTQLMYLVPKTLWVTANYKEAQTRKMRVGQRASFTVDALGDHRLKGYVESLAPAAGSEFAVLRPDNATGNFVKVAQRIAVRIRIDPNQPLADRLRPGMSVVARIKTDER
jgi:multidrug resistance efflux pump